MADRPQRRVAISVSLFNRYGVDLFSGIAQYIYEHPHWTTQHIDFVRETSFPVWLKSWKGDGIIIRNRFEQSDEIAAHTRAKVLDLSVLRDYEQIPVSVDFFQTIQLAMEHLQERFFRNFAFVGVQDVSFSCRYRDAFLQLSHGQGHVFEFSNHWFRRETSDDASLLKFRQWLLALPKPIGIVASHDPMGMRVIEECKLLKISVPEKVAVLGINNDDILCKMVRPPMSSVILDGKGIGYTACEILDQMMDGQTPPSSPILLPPLGIATRRSTDTLALDDKLLIRAVTYIRTNACFGITVNDVADWVGINRRTLERRFATSLGRSPLDEINQVKLQKVCYLLKMTDLTVKSIAQKTGFPTASYLYSVFRKQFATTPKEYRQSHAQKD